MWSFIDFHETQVDEGVGYLMKVKKPKNEILLIFFLKLIFE